MVLATSTTKEVAVRHIAAASALIELISVRNLAFHFFRIPCNSRLAELAKRVVSGGF